MIEFIYLLARESANNIQNNNDLYINLLSGLIGAMIASAISVYFMFKLENKKIKRDIQLRVANELNDIIKKCFSGIGNFNIDIWIAHLKMYNNFYKDMYEKQKDNGESYIEDFRLQELKRLNENKTKYDSDFFSMMNSIIDVQAYYESHCIVLSKFLKIFKVISKKSDKLLKINGEISNIYSDILVRIYSNNGNILDDEIKLIEALTIELNITKFDIAAYCYDFTIEIQNEFYSNIFNNLKISDRKPKKGNVLKAAVFKGKVIKLLDEEDDD